MEVRDIVNRDLINLQNCESEPIHVPGTIQPHGFLLGVQKDTFKVTYCSANATQAFNIPVEALLQQNLTSIIGATQFAEFKAYCADLHAGVYPFVLDVQDTMYSTNVHVSGDTILMELEPFPDGSLTVPDLYAQTRKFVHMIEESPNLQALCAAVADETRRITGYDRVMIYRFDKDYNGEVFAESKREDLEPFFGLHYPHTDIPAQARELYMRNLLRIIVDVNYTPVPIMTMEAATNTSLDLSLGVLRSISPIHIEYLKNMGVGATLTISLIHKKKLWGLITCHHYSAKNLPHYTRLAAKLQGHFLTSQIDVMQVVDEHDANLRISNDVTALSVALNKPDFLQALFSNALLHKFVGANGVALIRTDVCMTEGTCPDEVSLRALAAAIKDQSAENFLYTTQVATLFPEASHWSPQIAGLMYYKIGNDGDDCIMWFRPEVQTTVNWAGNPEKAVNTDGKGLLSPRKSFELWKQIVQLHSAPWTISERNGGHTFARELEKQILFDDKAASEERHKQLNKLLQQANEELRNMNWISAHDLREPLRKIQLFSSKITMVSDELTLPENIRFAVGKIKAIAERMQTLLDDILRYSMVTDDQEQKEPVNLNEICAFVRSELSEEIEASAGQLRFAPLPKVRGIKFQLQQLFLNLVSNSLKFAQRDLPPKIDVDYTLETVEGQPMHCISIQDNGIGFDEMYAKRIMHVFQRLHNSDEYEGTGIGLAICRKICETHGGTLTATGVLGEGSTFIIKLPA